MQDNLKDSMIANLTENRFLQQVQLVPFGFSLILRDAFMVCPPPKVWRGWIFFPKVFLIGGQILWGKVIGGGGGLIYVGELMIRSYQEERSFAK